jgi:pimeloyl-ACP methyl ester carboxylesterase
VATATANGIELYYERRGEGPPLLFLNGSGATLASVGPLLDPLAARFDLIAHDQRGIGRSAIPPGPYEMADYAADAAGLLDAVDVERCRVFGISFGGMVALELAVTWPDRIERLALACTSAGGAGGASYPLQELADLPPDERARRGLAVLDTRFTPEWLADHPRDAALVAGRAQRLSEHPDPEVGRGEREQMGARSGHDTFDRLGKISCPTLVTYGRYDGIAPPANSEAIAGAVHGAELRGYEGGHLFVAQDHTAVPDIIEFLGHT